MNKQTLVNIESLLRLKMVISSGFEFLSLGGLFVGVKSTVLSG